MDKSHRLGFSLLAGAIATAGVAAVNSTQHVNIAKEELTAILPPGVDVNDKDLASKLVSFFDEMNDSERDAYIQRLKDYIAGHPHLSPATTAQNVITIIEEEGKIDKFTVKLQKDFDNNPTLRAMLELTLGEINPSPESQNILAQLKSHSLSHTKAGDLEGTGVPKGKQTWVTAATQPTPKASLNR